jgi:hypothetical protein
MNKMFRYVRQNKQAIATGLTLASMGAANAAAGDPDTTAIVAAGASVAVIGAAVFAVSVGSKLWKWFKSVL